MIDLPMTVRNCPPISYSFSHLFADFSGSNMRNDSKIVFLTVPLLYIHIRWVSLGPICVAQHDGCEHSPSDKWRRLHFHREPYSGHTARPWLHRKVSPVSYSEHGWQSMVGRSCELLLSFFPSLLGKVNIIFSIRALGVYLLTQKPLSQEKLAQWKRDYSK